MEVLLLWLKRIWNAWNLQAFMLASLSLQIILIFSGSLRKRNSSWWVSLILWSAYLLADWVATFALGILSKTQDDHDCKSAEHSLKQNAELLAFWSPFLLLHLGGPDTITAFSLEDNELWMRHLLGLVFQVCVALYAFMKSLPDTRLIVPAFLMFLAGIINYGERSWSLMCASVDGLRKSMVTPPDPGPNYVKFMEEYSCMSAAGLHVDIVVENESEPNPLALDTEEEDIKDVELVSKAHYFFKTFKRLTVDLILTFHDRNESLSFFLKRSPDQAFKLIEFELSFIYEELFTKATALHTVAGPFLRLLTFSSIFSSLLFFFFTKKHGYVEADVTIAYILLVGALALESYAVGLLFFSEWTFLHLKKLGYDQLSDKVFTTISCFRPTNKPRWSNSMAQYSLISFCLADDESSAFKTTLKSIGMKDTWDKYWYTTYIPVTDELKEFIFKEIKGKASSAQDSKSYKRFSDYRGEWALQKKGYRKELGWSVEVELDESILLWHIATDLCFYSHKNEQSEPERNRENEQSEPDRNCENKQSEPERNLQMSKALSDYMLYLLLVRPSMLTAGIGQVRYGDTCAEAKIFFRRGEAVLDQQQASEKLLLVETKVPSVQIKGDRSKSVLFDACVLAKKLLDLKTGRRWRIISAVWVEMLCYAAIHCRSYFHMKQLNSGGELITLVWLLMAHFGLGDQYRIEAGHARAKLIVDNWKGNSVW
ncbi:uncharacterized protein LOC120252555 [Dioscorea cayenensis subsp. rotundata]|uniref:Uncharacterized protein LOC120252555 n=1 Tax=Dioscorea cayennensis subsp. rotundata TaxID=55577 RepID=A0AB40AR13_DIOCR|nr:uncharacterized protein LOC120252555 [Dioscorea cayenensis subsp. rotundata]